MNWLRSRTHAAIFYATETKTDKFKTYTGSHRAGYIYNWGGGTVARVSSAMQWQSCKKTAKSCVDARWIRRARIRLKGQISRKARKKNVIGPSVWTSFLLSKTQFGCFQNVLWLRLIVMQFKYPELTQGKQLMCNQRVFNGRVRQPWQKHYNNRTREA